MESPSEFYHKIEVLYMLSKGTGQGDHPHMIQVQYPSHQQAPTLRGMHCLLFHLDTSLKASIISPGISFSKNLTLLTDNSFFESNVVSEVAHV